MRVGTVAGVAGAAGEPGSDGVVVAGTVVAIFGRRGIGVCFVTTLRSSRRIVVRSRRRRDSPSVAANRKQRCLDGRGRMRRCTERSRLRRRLRARQPTSRGCGQRGDAAESRSERRNRRQSGKQRRVRKPGERADDHTHPAERHFDERAHETWVELLSRAAGYFRPRFGRSSGRLVRPGRRDDVEHVCNRNDPAAQRDLLTGDAARVSGAVPPFMVVADRPVHSPSQPRIGSTSISPGAGVNGAAPFQLVGGRACSGSPR